MTDKIRHRCPTTAAGVEVVYRTILPEFQLCERCERGQRNGHTAATPGRPAHTEADLVAWLHYFEVCHIDYPIRARFQARLHPKWDFGLPTVQARFVVYDQPDVLTGVTMPIEPQAGWLSAPSARPDANTPRWIRDWLLYHLEHELDEQLVVQNVHGFNPHDRDHYLCEDCNPPEVTSVRLTAEDTATAGHLSVRLPEV